MSLYSSLFLATILGLLIIGCNGIPGVNFDRTCSNLNQNFITRAWNDMVAMAQTAHDRTVAARDMTSSAGERRVVTNTFNTYFGVTPTDGLDFRVSNIIGSLADIMNPPFDLNPGITIACDDTYLTESTTDMFGYQLPPGVYQAVNERIFPPRWFPVGMERCSDTNANGNYIRAQSDSITNWITICPRTFSDYTAVSPATKDQDVSASGVYIGNIRPMSTALMHECLHLLYATFMANSRNGMVRYEVNGFQACNSLRGTNVADTIHMPDCIALYAFSLYMTGNDWSSGYPMVNPTQ